MNDKPRIGRPKGDGQHRNIGVYGTQDEIAAVLDSLTPRERMEAMIEALEARNDEYDGGRSVYSSRSGDL